MSQLQYKLFLWVRGAYPRRIVYQLLSKGMVTSPANILLGKTVLPNFDINVAVFEFQDGTPAFIDEDPSDPKPEGVSSPCLRIVDPAAGKTVWIHESNAIAWYIEDTFKDFRPLVGFDPLDRASAKDMTSIIDLMFIDFSYYVRHATAITYPSSRLENKDRSHGAALNALFHMKKNLVKLQSWAESTLRSTGWLTPGITEGPGIVDISLAGPMRFFFFMYGLDMFEDERLGLLRAWLEKMKTTSWWDEFEEQGDAVPAVLNIGKSCREV